MVQTAAYSRDGTQVVTASNDGTARIWRVYPDTQTLVDAAKAAVPRCLSGEQRQAAFLDPEPPPWCVEMAKWPYDTEDWRDWLEFVRSDQDPPLPASPQWGEWIDTRGGG